MSTLVENVAKVTAAHAALKTAIAAKGVAVPDGTKLTGMPALVEQIQTTPEPTNHRAVFAADSAKIMVVPKMLIVDMTDMQNLSYCFRDCTLLTSLTLPDGFGQNATTLDYCFRYCTSLTSLTLPDGFGQNATRFVECFRGCTLLTSLTLPDGFGQNATTLDYCFLDCNSLTTITGNPNFKVSVDFSSCKKLTHDSITVIINGLQTVTGQTLTLGTVNLAKLTDEEKKVATDKGWTLA